MNTPANPLPPSANFHLWQPCNMRCEGCFATFDDVRTTVLPKGHLPRAAAIALSATLGATFDKVTFAGGEPTLAPWLPQMVTAAKQAGATTMVVSNGSKLDGDLLDRLAPVLDWLVLSIDSADPGTHDRLGRRTVRGPLDPEHYVRVASRARALGLRLKINTVVSAANAHEYLTPFIADLRPERWKLLQVLPVDGQNDGSVEPLLIDAATFEAYATRQRALLPGSIVLVPESNDDMTGSYAMVDPAGRFFDNTAGHHTYSRPIAEVGVRAAWSEVRFHADRFADRGGVYAW